MNNMSRRIPLTNSNKKILVDSKFVKILSHHKWFLTGTRIRSTIKPHKSLKQIILESEIQTSMKGYIIRNIDRNVFNCTLANLKFSKRITSHRIGKRGIVKA